ncbi:MAG TPA: FtsQ-type POTRA domain-containing protein [Pyrinomonadaceae bacterium]|jgi:cell division septal protein FtsQ
MLREQVITPRAGRAGAAGGATQAGKRRASGGDVVQRPARRGGASRGGNAVGATRGRALAFLPLAFKLLLAASVGVALFAGYRAAASASFFAVRSIEVDGAARSSAEEMRTIVRRATATTGVWRADIAAISAELGRQPWVRAAVVSRVLPSGVRVRVREREPLMVARTNASGRLVWVDEEGVMLGNASTTDQLNSFFIRGLDETSGDASRPENRERMKKVLEMKREWEAAGLAGRVSEVNLGDVHDVRAQLTGNDSQIEVRLGGRDFGARLDEALKTLDKVRQKRPEIVVTRLDATQVTFDAARAARGGRVIVGHKPGGSQSPHETTDPLTDNTATDNSAAAPVAAVKSVDSVKEKKPSEHRRDERRDENRAQRAAGENKQKPNNTRERQVNGRTPSGVAGERPRRVG